MTKKSYYLFYLLTGLIFLFFIQVLYLFNNNSMDSKLLNQKLTFVKITALPDLAISTEATYIRHRSLSTIFSIYKEDGDLREFAPSSFTFNNSRILNDTK